MSYQTSSKKTAERLLKRGIAAIEFDRDEKIQKLAEHMRLAETVQCKDTKAAILNDAGGNFEAATSGNIILNRNPSFGWWGQSGTRND